METTYYIIVDGQQQGPLVHDELKFRYITPETYIWREGLEGWVKAGTLPELSDLFTPAQPKPDTPRYPTSQQMSGQQPSYQPPYGQGYNRPYQQPGSGQYYEEPIAHTNWLPWAIVATVLGFCTSCIGSVLGIIGIVYANKANDFYNRGNRAEGERNNNTARTCTIIGLVLAGIGLIGSIALLRSGTAANMVEILNAID